MLARITKCTSVVHMGRDGHVVEKDHAPVEHGTLEYGIADARLDGPLISDILVQQARAFLESYLSRRTLSART